MIEGLSAFAGCAPVAAVHAGATAVPVEPLSVVSVTAWNGSAAALADAVRAAFGLDLPPPGRWTQAGELAALWVGPDHWWLQREHASALLAELTPVAGDHAALIDISDARAVLSISGPAAPTILASLLPIDLHPRAFLPGYVASTVAAHIGVQVRQIDAAPTYHLSCLRSFAGSLWRSVELAGAGRIRLG
jgi:heterotetrameric sarcosine oxidase gamma subunit